LSVTGVKTRSMLRSSRCAARPFFPFSSGSRGTQAATKGGNALKQFQERAIDAIFRGRHVAVAVSTGGGKTAVMLYAILRAARAGPPRVHVMLMPLLSLQRDFKAGYQAWCSDVLFLSVVDESSAKEVEGLMVRTAARVVPEKSVVVLLSPEHLKRLKDALLMARDMVGFFCVDECHTMIGWEGFRPDFTALHMIARDLPTTTFIAASATLLPENERPVLVERLGLEWNKCEVVRVFLGSRQQHVHYVERGMLGVEARTIFGHDRMDMLVFVTAVADLAPARAQIMRWSGLTEHNVRMFCSNMSNEYKAGVDDWLRAPGQGARVLVTTVAFGMGVDLASIKSVVLWTLPRDAPGLFQALGRARPSSDGGPLHLTVVLSVEEGRRPDQGYLRRGAKVVSGKGLGNVHGLQSVRAQDVRRAGDCAVHVCTGRGHVSQHAEDAGVFSSPFEEFLFRRKGPVGCGYGAHSVWRVRLLPRRAACPGPSQCQELR
jgi:hypothetical protein